MSTRPKAAETFENSIAGFTLKFRNPTLESAYMCARMDFKLLSVATRRFLGAIVLAHLSFHLLDMYSAASANPNYAFSPQTWLAQSFLVLIIGGEALSYFCTRMSSLRGIFFTLFGLFMMLNTTFSAFCADVYYPFIGTKYALVLAEIV